MIARKPHPGASDDPTRVVSIPLVFDRQLAEWVTLLGPEGYQLDEIDAARVCVAAFQREWDSIVVLARQLRAFTEHREFEFQRDGIDSTMIADGARALSTAITMANGNLGPALGRGPRPRLAP